MLWINNAFFLHVLYFFISWFFKMNTQTNGIIWWWWCWCVRLVVHFYFCNTYFPSFHSLKLYLYGGSIARFLKTWYYLCIACNAFLQFHIIYVFEVGYINRIFISVCLRTNQYTRWFSFVNTKKKFHFSVVFDVWF